MKRLISLFMAGMMLGGVGFANHAEAGDHWKRRRAEVRRESRHDRYIGRRDVYVLRDYYRPYKWSPPTRHRHRYYRGGYLPPGWVKRIRPVPVYVERDLVVVPRGYRRGVIDGQVVVHNDRGFILDVAFLF